MSNQNPDKKSVTRVDAELSTKDRISRVTGTIFGAACANSLAGSTIGLSHKEINATLGLSGLDDFIAGLSRSHLPDHKPGELLADAFLALALGESLIDHKGSLSAPDLKKRFADLLADRTFTAASAGTLCIASMRNLVDETRPAEGGPEALHVNAAARAFVAGCLPGQPKTSDAVEVASAQARLTHGDMRAAASAAVIADSVSYFIAGNRLDNSTSVREYVAREIEIANLYDGRFAEAWDDIAPDLDYSRKASELPYSLVNVQSTVTEMVPTAVGIFLIFRHSAKEAIQAAARSGGDTDKIAIIVGALAGSYHGVEAIPLNWLEKVQHKERLQLLSDKINSLWN